MTRSCRWPPSRRSTCPSWSPSVCCSPAAGRTTAGGRRLSSRPAAPSAAGRSVRRTRKSPRPRPVRRRARNGTPSARHISSRPLSLSLFSPSLRPWSYRTGRPNVSAGSAADHVRAAAFPPPPRHTPRLSPERNGKVKLYPGRPVVGARARARTSRPEYAGGVSPFPETGHVRRYPATRSTPGPVRGKCRAATTHSRYLSIGEFDGRCCDEKKNNVSGRQYAL